MHTANNSSEWQRGRERERVKLSFSQQVRFFKVQKAHLKTKRREKPKQRVRFSKVLLHEMERIISLVGVWKKRTDKHLHRFFFWEREINHIEMLFNLMGVAHWKQWGSVRSCHCSISTQYLQSDDYISSFCPSSALLTTFINPRYLITRCHYHSRHLLLNKTNIDRSWEQCV